MNSYVDFKFVMHREDGKLWRTDTTPFLKLNYQPDFGAI